MRTKHARSDSGVALDVCTTEPATWANATYVPTLLANWCWMRAVHVWLLWVLLLLLLLLPLLLLAWTDSCMFIAGCWVWLRPCPSRVASLHPFITSPPPPHTHTHSCKPAVSTAGSASLTPPVHRTPSPRGKPASSTPTPSSDCTPSAAGLQPSWQSPAGRSRPTAWHGV